MTKRTAPDITIYRPAANSQAAEVQTVPITEESKRVFSLMSEDYIELHFTLAEAVAFEVGDYVDDELFGRFVITEKQMPSYDTSTGGYDYSLKLEREYRKWKNWVFMLTSVMSNGTRVRKESNWALTSDLRLQGEEIIHNLDVIGETYNGRSYLLEIDGYDADGNAIPASEATAKELNMQKKAPLIKCLAYTGTKILEALKSIADAWECEWWVTYETRNGVKRGILHFGKCENEDTEKTFTLDSNMENVSAQSNRSKFANRLLVFGSSQNVPDTYRKSLKFKATYAESKYVKDRIPLGNVTFAGDSDHRVTSDMLSGAIEGTIGFENQQYPAGTFGLVMQGSTEDTTAKTITDIFATEGSTYSDFVAKGGKVKFSGAIDYTLPIDDKNRKGVAVEVSIKTEVRIYSVKTNKFVGTLYSKSETFNADFTSGSTVNYEHSISFNDIKLTLDEGAHQVDIRVEVVYSSEASCEPRNGTLSATDSSATTDCIEVTDTGTTKTSVITCNGKTATAQWVTDDAGRYGFLIVGAGFLKVGDEYTVNFYDGTTDGLLLCEIPMSWWTSEYDDPSSLALIGGNNLQLPIATNGWLQRDTSLTKDQIVEEAVVFDKIYPRCVLRITGIEMVDKKSYEENADGSKTYWNWVQYKLTARNLNGEEFRFDKSFIKSGETLRIKFLSDEEEQDAWNELGMTEQWQSHDGYLLAGMTFDVNFKNLSQLYTIVRNDNYGAMLPNATMRPKVGDPFILVGWDVRAMSSLNLIEAAEKELEEAGWDYLDAIEKDQFTFTCEMMSEQEGIILTEGQKVCVHHEALGIEDEHSKREKHSRIIGYELKLDIPYDSPKYTIGESDAYSRLKQMENDISGLSGSTSSNTGTSSGGGSSSSSGGGGSVTTAVSADNAKYAERAGVASEAKVADKAVSANEAAHSESAANLDEDSPTREDFLSSTADDEAAGKIAFLGGMTFGDHGSGKGVDEEGNAAFGDLSGGNATLETTTVEQLSDDIKKAVSNRDLVSGAGFELYKGADGKGRLWVDELNVRNKAYFASLDIRKVSYSGGTCIFSNAGSEIVKVVEITNSSGAVTAYQCFLKADDGTTRTTNYWRVGMQALCQTFNVEAGVYEGVQNRYYWRLVVGVGRAKCPTQTSPKGEGTRLSDEIYDYVILSNVASLTGRTTVPTVVESELGEGTDWQALEWGASGVVSLSTRATATWASVVKSATGETAPSTSYGYDSSVANDAPRPQDVIVQVGDQVEAGKYGHCVKQTTSSMDDDGSAPSYEMYYKISGFKWETRTAKISPQETVFFSDYFKISTKADGSDAQTVGAMIEASAEGISSTVSTVRSDLEKAVADEKTAREQADSDEAAARDKAIGDATTALSSKIEQSATEINATVSEVQTNLDGTVEKLEAAGIHIDSKEIDLSASTVRVNDASGTAVAVFENGKLNADLIDADTVEVQHVFAKNDAGTVVGHFGRANDEDNDTDYPLWVGAETPLDPDEPSAKDKGAPFRVDKNGAIYSRSGYIGGFNITSSSIGINDQGASRNDMVRMTESGYDYWRFSQPNWSATGGNGVSRVNIGYEPSSVFNSEGIGAMVIKETKDDGSAFTFGLEVSAYGNVTLKNPNEAGWNGVHALFIPHGDICGLRPKTRVVSVDTVLDTYDSIIMHEGSSAITLYLPDNPERGQTYLVINSNYGARTTIKTNNSSYLIYKRDVNGVTSWNSAESCQMWIVVFTGEGWHIATFTNN